MTVKYPKETVVGLWGLPLDDNPEEGIEIVEDKQIGNSRWSKEHSLVVRIKGDLFRTKYTTGATEMQDERPWEYDDEVVFQAVRAVEKTVIVYEVEEK